MTKLDRKQLYKAKVKNRYSLTRDSSSKQTWHVTLDIKGLDLDFEPGDSIGIYPQNDPLLVEHLIDAMQSKMDAPIVHKRSGEEMTLHTFLTHHANLARISSSFLKLIHECETCKDKKNEVASLLENRELLRSYLSEKDPLDLLRTHSPLPLQELCDQFAPLLPRYYSVASSKNHQKDLLDLTVALFTWEHSGEKRYGVASHFLCHLAEIGETPIPFFVQPATHFRVPDHEKNIIMIGPGTGIAPFRAFLQERAHHSATGKNWLFFGERNRKSDYFYEEEWKKHPNLEVHTAFSRDQEEKIYVQHKLLENGPEIYRLLEEGAHLYVCGDAKVMARDVEKTLREILQKNGPFDEEGAKSHLKALKKEGRYCLDVY